MNPRVILICGKICSGKSHLAREMAEKEKAVILSVDEITTLYGPDLGDRHDIVTRRVQEYLCRKAREILACGVPVILDWGFWNQGMRAFARQALAGLPLEWHYLDISDGLWQSRIEKRNAHPGPADYTVDPGLKQKCLDLFEAPSPGEIDVWHTVG